MNLDVMSYKNYSWPYNPQSLEIVHNRNLKEQIIPFCGNVIQDLGRAKRIIKGSGTFFGQNYIEQFNQIKEVFDQKGTGTLKIPNLEPLVARFKSLSIQEDPRPLTINYSFEFWEEFSDTYSSPEASVSYHIVTDGETLFDISHLYNIPVETLLSLNSFIKRPDNILGGQKVNLR